MQKAHKKEMQLLKSELDAAKKQRDATLSQMKKLNETVVRPLVEQVVLRDKEISQMKEENRTLQENTRKIHTVVRSSKMSDIYRKEELRVKTKKQMEQERDDAYTLMQQNQVTDETMPGFIKDLSASVRKSLKIRRRNSFKSHTLGLHTPELSVSEISLNRFCQSPQQKK